MALWARRRTSRRSVSPDRIAAVVSSCNRSRRVTGWLLGRHGVDRSLDLGRRALRAAPMVGSPGSRSRSTRRAWSASAAGPKIRPSGPGRLALARACVLLALRFLALPLHGRLLVVLATASLREDAALLDLLVEAAEGALERLVLTHSDFSQSVFTSSDQDLASCVRRAADRPGRSSDGAAHARSARAAGA